jgi:hypothetical protein
MHLLEEQEGEGEGRGVARDVLTEFWHIFYQSLSVGASVKIPVIRHDYNSHVLIADAHGSVTQIPASSIYLLYDA